MVSSSRSSGVVGTGSSPRRRATTASRTSMCSSICRRTPRASGVSRTIGAERFVGCGIGSSGGGGDGSRTATLAVAAVPPTVVDDDIIDDAAAASGAARDPRAD